MAFTVIARLKARAGHEGEVERGLREITSHTRNEAGTLAFIVHRSTEDPAVFVVYEVYTDRAAFETHFNAPYVQENLARFKNLTESASHDLLAEVVKK